jgi:hypothetical protein
VVVADVLQRACNAGDEIFLPNDGHGAPSILNPLRVIHASGLENGDWSRGVKFSRDGQRQSA